jgi:hypothetical protein
VHAQAATSLRRDRLAVVPLSDQTVVERRALSDYDTAFGLSQGAV